MTKRNPNASQQGFTLIELIIFIVVVGLGMAGILMVINTVVKSSADPMVQKQAVAIAESMLEEILLKDYANPVGGDTGSTRALFDDVDQYNSYSSIGIKDLTGATIPALVSYNINSVSVCLESACPAPINAALSAASAKRVTVSVTGPNGVAVSLKGYRTNY